VAQQLALEHTTNRIDRDHSRRRLGFVQCEALNGIILLGMTTALMYGLIQRVWPIENRALPHVPRSSRDNVAV
jgi:hypothetical protein